MRPSLITAPVLSLCLISVSHPAAADAMGGMSGVLGGYSMSREASGTSWQPESSPMEGIMDMDGDWMTMLHGYVVQVHDHQGGPRGGSEDFSASMFMAMAQRQFGDDTLGFRAMLSLDPLMGPAGYPLLLQTGETADGVTHLVDRQHPHDLFMELSASWSHSVDARHSLFFYGGLPGEPALGPPTFMHRASGMDIPEAPISHHWLDSTHVTFGVATVGYVWDTLKFEASAFHGREPDPFRWNIETGRLDSASARVTWNPDERWSLQVSRGFIHSPEELDPGLNQHRSTASALYEQPLDWGRWSSTLAWGQNDNRPAHKLDAWLAESELQFHDVHTVFARLERVQEDELFGPPSPLAGGIYGVTKLSTGYIHDWHATEHLRFGVGGLISLYDLPSPLHGAYGSPHSYMLFVRLKLE